MLVLSRKPMEAIRIGGDVRIVVVRLGPNNVRLGIDAPSDVPVHRLEVYDALCKQEGKAAAFGGKANHSGSQTSSGDKKG